MDFRTKTVEELLTWLENKGYDEWIREVFEGLLFLFSSQQRKVQSQYLWLRLNLASS